MGKVLFGLKNAHYSVLDDKGAYGTPVSIPGSVSMSLSVEGETTVFWADDIKYAVFDNNGGYTGDYELAWAQAQMLMDLLGWERGANGELLEFADAQTKTCALLYEVSSNVAAERFCFYSVTFGRPDLSANTKNESTTPDTVTFPITITSHEIDWGDEKRELVKASIEKKEATATAFNAWFDSVTIPTKPSA